MGILKSNADITIVGDEIKSAIEPHSYRVDAHHPVVIYPYNLLKQAGFVQEIFLADVIVGSKE